jgi:hypothetical protein
MRFAIGSLPNSKALRFVSVFFAGKRRLRETDGAPHPSQNDLVLPIGERQLASNLHEGAIFERA